MAINQLVLSKMFFINSEHPQQNDNILIFIQITWNWITHLQMHPHPADSLIGTHFYSYVWIDFDMPDSTIAFICDTPCLI